MPVENHFVTLFFVNRSTVVYIPTAKVKKKAEWWEKYGAVCSRVPIYHIKECAGDKLDRQLWGDGTDMNFLKKKMLVICCFLEIKTTLGEKCEQVS